MDNKKLEVLVAGRMVNLKIMMLRFMIRAINGRHDVDFEILEGFFTSKL